MKQIADHIFSIKMMIYVFLVITMLETTSSIYTIIGNVNGLIITWALLGAVYKIVKERKINTDLKSVLVYMFLLSFFISIVINRDINLMANLKILMLVVIYLFVFFLDSESSNRDEAEKSIHICNTILIYMSLILSFAGLMTFFFWFEFSIFSYPQGFHSPSLWGFYKNPNTGGMIAVISIIATIIDINFLKGNSKKHFGLYKKLIYISNIVIQSLFILQSGSRGSLLAIIIVVFVLLFDRFAYFFKKILPLKRITLRTAFSIALAILTSFAAITGIYYTGQGIKHATALVPPKVRDALIDAGYGVLYENGLNIGAGGKGVQFTVDREIEAGNISTGRFTIWKSGLKALKFRPVFGFGPNNIDVAKMMANPDDIKSGYVTTGNMHNGFLQILLSTGILGFVIFSVLYLMLIFRLVNAYLKSRRDLKKRRRILLISSMILAISVIGIVENIILIIMAVAPLILWVYIGYTRSLISDDEISD